MSDHDKHRDDHSEVESFIDEFERTVNLKSPPLDSDDDHEATVQLNDISSLFAEEPPASAKSAGPTAEASETPGKRVESQDAPPRQQKDNASATAAKKATASTKPPTGTPRTADAANDRPEPKPRKMELTEEAMLPADEPAATEPPVAGEADETGKPAQPRSEPDDRGDRPSDGETPPAAPASDAPASEAPASDEAPASRPSTASPLLTLLAIAALGAGGAAWWQANQASERLDRLEQRLTTLERQVARSPAATGIKALNDRVNKLAARLEKHLKAVAMNPASPATAPAAASAAQPKPPAPHEVATRPAITPATPKAAASHARPATAKPAKASAAPATSSGPWVVNLTSLSDIHAAKAEVSRLRRMGIAAERIAVRAGGRTWQRIRVTGFASRKDAEQASRALSRRLGLTDVWVSRR